MNKKIMKFMFDVRAMGFLFYIPLIAVVFLMIYIFAEYRHINTFVKNVIPTLEFSIPTVAAWWSSILFYNMLEEDGGEILFTYPQKRLSIGTLRVVTFLLLYSILIIVCVIIIQLKVDERIFVSLVIQFFSQSYFFSGLGFVSMIITKNVLWSFSIPLMYTFLQIFYKELQIFSVSNIFFFNENVLSLSQMSPKLVLIMVVGTIFFILGQIMINKYQKN